MKGEQSSQDDSAEHTRQIREAFNDGRDTPYTTEEVAELNPQHWIIQKDKGFYIWFAGAYRGPYTMAEIPAAAWRDLAPAWEVGVALHKMGNQGRIVRKTVAELMRDYGTVADKVVVDLSAQKCSYDPTTRTMIEAPCPLRSIEPRFNRNIAGFLEIMAGTAGRLEKLLQWVASATLLSQSEPTLLLTGRTRTGKTLFGFCVSRLYSCYWPTPLATVLDGAADALARNPICLADDVLAADLHGRFKGTQLWAPVHHSRRSLHRKNLPTAVLQGTTRTIIAANDARALGLEIEAIRPSVLHIPVPPKAAEYLARLDQSVIASWVDDDQFAAHALWLRDNPQWAPERRPATPAK